MYFRNFTNKGQSFLKYFDFNIYQGENVNLEKWKGYHPVKEIESHLVVCAPLHLIVGDFKGRHKAYFYRTDTEIILKI